MVKSGEDMRSNRLPMGKIVCSTAAVIILIIVVLLVARHEWWVSSVTTLMSQPNAMVWINAFNAVAVAVTAVIVALYTRETSRLRLEAQRQTSAAITAARAMTEQADLT